MNINFGLLPPMPERIRGKRERYTALAMRALDCLEQLRPVLSGGFGSMKIIIDAMGGDNAPDAIVRGAVQAADQLGVDIVLVGDEARVRPLLEQSAPQNPDRITVHHASEIITMEDNPISVVRQKKDSSLVVALRLLGEGAGDAMVSAGSTGALLTGATLFVKRIKGVRRAALAPVLPTAKGGSLLVDCGANVECSAESLVQFAFMGYYYTQKQMGMKNPRVGLINTAPKRPKAPTRCAKPIRF